MEDSIAMLDPSGFVRLVPNERFEDAIAYGGEVVIPMIGPDNIERWIPLSRVRDAMLCGGLPVQ